MRVYHGCENPTHWVYCIVEAEGPRDICKIGVAANIGARLSALQGGNYRKLEMVWIIGVPDRQFALDVEFSVLSWRRQASDGGRLSSEWVVTTPEQAFEWACKFFSEDQIKRVS